jgi:hypothetical protein
MRKLAQLTLTCGVILGHGAAPTGRIYAQEPADRLRIVRVRSESPEISVLFRRASETSASAEIARAQRETLEDALLLAGLRLADLPIELTSELYPAAAPSVEAWTSYDADGKGSRVVVFTGSVTFRCASKPRSSHSCLLMLASDIVHEVCHFRNGPNEPDAYQTQIAYLIFSGASSAQIAGVRANRDRALLDLRKAIDVAKRPRAGALGQASATDPAGSNTTRLVRVRSENPEIAAVISRAPETSPTFRQLMETIDGTDGLIYVDYGKCGHGVRACLVLNVQVAGPFRILHVRVESRRLDCGLMASIGHELQHAIEILSHPHVTSGAAAYLLYDRIAGQGTGADNGRFETKAADRAGVEVRHEACRVEGR